MSSAPNPQSDADQLEAAADQAIEACGGDAREAVKALIISNYFLETELEKLKAAVSTGYARGKLFGARARKLDKSVHSEGQSAFSKLMIEARKSARLTQHELAKRLHKPQSFVAKYEGGERRIDVVEFVTVCQAIGADPAKLLKALIKAIGGASD
jgi:DNA-binding transcriptional regulator YiaG